MAALKMVRRRRALRGLHMSVLAGLVAGSSLLSSGDTADAAILLDDFESGFGGMTGALTTSEPAPAQRPGMQAGMRVSPAGHGACDHLTGTSRALCGADTRKWAGSAGTILSYAVDFPRISAILFDLAAFSDDDPFDHYDGENPNTWGDYVRVSSWVSGAETLLAEFTGLQASERASGHGHHLVSTDNGALLGPGIVADASFDTVSLYGLKGRFGAAGDLIFEIRSTGSAEQIGIDNVRLVPASLPGTLTIALLGVAALGAARRMQRG